MSEHERRRELVRAHRQRGVYIPTDEVPLHLANGWRVLDDCPCSASDDVLLTPPATFAGRVNA